MRPMVDPIATSPNAATGPSAGASRPPFVRLDVHALSAGTWPASPADFTVTGADLIAMAAAYNAGAWQAPVVIGHPETDDPAWGWVLSAGIRDDGLHLEIEVLPEMADLIESRRYQNVSLALWAADAAGNPTPGVWGIKHLGFLGAVPPAVKGLNPVRLNADGAGADTLLVTFKDPAMSDSNSMSTVQLAEREQALAAREQALAARERELLRSNLQAEFGAHVAAGRIAPADVPGLVELAERLTTAPVVTLSEGQKPALDVLRNFVSGIAPRVALGTHAAAERSAAAIKVPGVPQGYRLSEAGLDLHTRAVELQSATPGMTYLDAVRAAESNV